MRTSRRTSHLAPQSAAHRRSRRTQPRRISVRPLPNSAPSQWGRRLARIVGEHFGVEMSLNHAKNEGSFKGRDIVIKCAKSPTPPISVLATMLERLDEVWAVFVMPEGDAEVWIIPARGMRKHAHHTHGKKAAPRFEITRRRLVPHAKLLGMLPAEDVERCQIP